MDTLYLCKQLLDLGQSSEEKSWYVPMQSYDFSCATDATFDLASH
jgi:hypothetical protein